MLVPGVEQKPGNDEWEIGENGLALMRPLPTWEWPKYGDDIAALPTG
jgi:hypothetical protein